MTAIRALEREDLTAVATLYADFVGWGPAATVPGLVEFFADVLLDHPFADPEIPTLVYDDGRDGVVGFISSHARRFVHDEQPVRIGCFGPLVVHREQRRRGVATQLLRSYVEGPQEMTVNDRSIDHVHAIWESLGGVTDTAASIGWSRVLAPAGFLAGALARRATGRHRLPGQALLSRVDARAGRGLHPVPRSGTREPLGNEALLDLLPRLGEHFSLLPAYDEAFLAWLFPTMERVDVGDRLVRRLVRADDGRPLGAYVMYVSVHETANVIKVAAAGDDVGLVLDHLMHDAAEEGAVSVRGRFEPHLLPYLRSRWCRLVRVDWAGVQARDPALVNTVLSGRALLTRMDGEWWMRPRPSAA